MVHNPQIVQPVASLRSPHVDGRWSCDKAGTMETSGRDGELSLERSKKAPESELAFLYVPVSFLQEGGNAQLGPFSLCRLTVFTRERLRMRVSDVKAGAIWAF